MLSKTKAGNDEAGNDDLYRSHFREYFKRVLQKTGAWGSVVVKALRY